MLIVHANFPIDPEKMDEAREIIDDLVDASNDEPGMIDYRAAVDVQDGHTIRFVERYEDRDAFAAHLETDHFQAFDEQLPDLLGGQPEAWRFEVEDATELDL